MFNLIQHVRKSLFQSYKNTALKLYGAWLLFFVYALCRHFNARAAGGRDGQVSARFWSPKTRLHVEVLFNHRAVFLSYHLNLPVAPHRWARFKALFKSRRWIRKSCQGERGAGNLISADDKEIKITWAVFMALRLWPLPRCGLNIKMGLYCMWQKCLDRGTKARPMICPNVKSMRPGTFIVV